MADLDRMLQKWTLDDELCLSVVEEFSVWCLAFTEGQSMSRPTQDGRSPLEESIWVGVP